MPHFSVICVLSFVVLSYKMISKGLKTSDVTKLVEIRIDFQNSSNANANRGIHFISRNVMHWLRSIR